MPILDRFGRPISFKKQTFNAMRRGGKVATDALPDGAVVSFKLFLKLAKRVRDDPRFHANLCVVEQATGRTPDLLAFNRMTSEEQDRFVKNMKFGEATMRKRAKEEHLTQSEKAYAQIDAVAA